MDRLKSLDLTALGGHVLEAPSGRTLRRLEHALALYVAYRVGREVVRLGPSGLKKAITGLVLRGEPSPLARTLVAVAYGGACQALALPPLGWLAGWAHVQA
jgi:hypothetical protein